MQIILNKFENFSILKMRSGLLLLGNVGRPETHNVLAIRAEALGDVGRVKEVLVLKRG